MPLTSKERIKTAISHEKPDRVPVYGEFTKTLTKKLEEKYGKHEDEIGVVLGNDMVKARAGIETSSTSSDLPEFTCKWGITFKNVKNATGEYTEIVSHPLAGDESKLNSYKIPDPFEESHYDPMRHLVSKYSGDKWIVGSCRQSIFEASWYLRGLDQFLIDMAIDEDYANALMDKVMQFPLEAGKKYIELGADMVWLGDDVAMQTGMMMSMDMWRKYLKPRYAYIFNEYRKMNKDIVIAYHSCGNCEPIFMDMYEIGLDVIHPIQPLCMDPVEIKKKYGKYLTLFGGVDIQDLLPNGTREEVLKESKRLIEGCGENGGYIYSPAHYIQSDTSIENVEAFYDAVNAYGRY